MVLTISSGVVPPPFSWAGGGINKIVCNENFGVPSFVLQTICFDLFMKCIAVGPRTDNILVEMTVFEDQ